MFKKVGRALKGFGKKLGDGFKAVKGFGQKVMKGVEELGLGDVAKEAGSQLAQTGREALERRGIPASNIELVGRAAAGMTPGQRRDLARGVATQAIRYGGEQLRGRLGRR